MPVDSYIQVPPDSTGKLVDCDVLTVGANTVYRERDRIAGTNPDELGDVRGNGIDAAPTDYGAVVRQAPPNSSRASGFSVTLVKNTPQTLITTSAIGGGLTGYALKAILSSTGMALWTISAGATVLAYAQTSGSVSFPYEPPRQADSCPAGSSFTVVCESIDPVTAEIGGYATFWWETYS
jgi:hypothetical protein